MFNSTKKKTAADFDAFLEEAYQANLELYRLPSTYLGESRYNDTFPTTCQMRFSAKELAHYTKFKAELGTYPDEILTEDQRLAKGL